MKVLALMSLILLLVASSSQAPSPEVPGRDPKKLQVLILAGYNIHDWRATFADLGDAGQGAIAARWNLTNTPTPYVLDARGVIRYNWPGGAGHEAIDAALDELIKEVEVPR
jgi:hypothetical protein